MNRRTFITLLGGAAAWPIAARGQSSIPIIGFINGSWATAYAAYVQAFIRGLAETGHTVGENVAIEYRWAEGHYDRVPDMVDDLVRRRVAVLQPDAFLINKRIVALAARDALPAMYSSRELVAAGGLMSYGSSLADMYRQMGIYAGKVLKGANPAEMPVLQPTKFEMAINLKTAKAIGLKPSDNLLSLADEVIE